MIFIVLCLLYCLIYSVFIIYKEGGKSSVSKVEEVSISKEEKITNKQLRLLKLAYRFRFITSKQIAKYFKQKSLRTAQIQLNTLNERGYLGKRHDGTYKIQGRAAEYYLTPKSTPILRKQLAEPSESELKQSYTRAISSQRFINYSLEVFDIYLELNRLYGDNQHFFTKPQLNTEQFGYFPHPLPDAFITIDGDNERHYFVEYFDDEVSIGIHGRKIAGYMKYKESGEWNDTGFDFPTVVIICQSPAMLKRAEKRVRYLDRQEFSEISFRLIDLDTLQVLDSANKKAWIDPIEQSKTIL